MSNYRHARRYDQRTAQQRFQPVTHRVAELTVAEQAKLLLLMDTKPQEFMQQVNMWRAQNSGDTMRFGSDDAPSTIFWAGYDAI